MIANILNTLLGLWLSYVAIFMAGAGAQTPWAVALAAVAIVVLALVARRSDFAAWQSSTNIVIGVLLLVLTLVGRATSFPPLVSFWIDLWTGLTVASLALWAALYHPKQEVGQGHAP